MVFYYFITFGLGFIIDKIKNKVINIVLHKCSKQLLLTYTAEWHSSQRASLLDILDWIIL